MTTKPIDRSAVPSAGSPRPFNFPDVHSVYLDNGLRALSVLWPDVPLVSVQLLTPAGGITNPMDRPGLAELHSSLLQEGTERFTSSELALAVEQLGGSLETGAGWNAAYSDAGLLSASFDQGLEIVAETMLQPTFPEARFEWLKDRTAADLLRRPSRARLLADDIFADVVYGGSVYGFPIKGNRESLEATTLDDVLDLHRRQVVPGGSTLVVAGDFDQDHLVNRANQLLGSWQPGTPISLPEIKPSVRSGLEIHIADRKGSAQTQLQIGHASIPRSDPRFPVLIALNVLLGGKFTSRLNLNLRERHGFTYGIQSSFARRLGPGPFTVRTAVATDVAGAAVREVLFELKRLREEPIPVEELTETLDYLLGVFPYTVQTTDDMARRLENMAIFDLPLDYYDRFPEMMRALKPSDLEEAARAQIQPDQLVIVAAGPAEELEPQLAELGPVTIHSS